MNWREVEYLDVSKEEHVQFARAQIRLCNDAVFLLTEKDGVTQRVGDNFIEIGNLSLNNGKGRVEVHHLAILVAHQRRNGDLEVFRLGTWLDELNALKPKVEAARNLRSVKRDAENAKERREKFGRI